MKLVISGLDSLKGRCKMAKVDYLAAALAHSIEILTGNPTKGSELKNLVYGPSSGGVAIAAYINECARRGVKLWSIGGSSAGVVRAMRTMLRQGCPVLVVELHPQSATLRYMLVFYGMDEPTGTLSALDLYAKDEEKYYITWPDEKWVMRFKISCAECWTLERLPYMNVPQGWMDDGTILTAPNEIKVAEEFRKWVLTHNWDKENWPVEPAHMVPLLDLNNPVLGPGLRQRFRWTTLLSTSQRGVFMAETGCELLYMEKALRQSRREGGESLAHVREKLQDIQEILMELRY